MGRSADRPIHFAPLFRNPVTAQQAQRIFHHAPRATLQFAFFGGNHRRTAAQALLEQMKKPIPPNLVDLLFCFIQLLVRHSTSLNEAELGSGRGSFRIRLVAGLRIDQRSPLVEMPGTYFGRNRISPVVASVKHAGFPFPTVGIAALHDEPFDHAVEKHSVVGARTA